MSMKLRRRRDHVTREQELNAWGTFFSYGHDYFGDLKQLGLDYEQGHEREQLDGEARAAWATLGALFLSAWMPKPVRDKPWALEAYGDPPAGL